MSGYGNHITSRGHSWRVGSPSVVLKSLSLSGEFFLLQFPSQPFGGVASDTEVVLVPVWSVAVCQPLGFFLFTFCRRHLCSMLLPPFCPPILEPDLKHVRGKKITGGKDPLKSNGERFLSYFHHSLPKFYYSFEIWLKVIKLHKIITSFQNLFLNLVVTVKPSD